MDFYTQADSIEEEYEIEIVLFTGAEATIDGNECFEYTVHNSGEPDFPYNVWLYRDEDGYITKL